MILRPLHPAAPANERLLPAWQVVERLQRQKYESCWMITQPSHAVLAGQLAANLQSPQIPRLDTELLRAIALHDAGWGSPTHRPSRAAGRRNHRRRDRFSKPKSK